MEACRNYDPWCCETDENGEGVHPADCRVCGFHEYEHRVHSRVYPCEECGAMRSATEGGTVFTVCDACWDRAYVRIDWAAMRLLARNLETGAALCRAFEDGLYEAEMHRLYHEHGYRLEWCWQPGCGEPAP